MFTRNNLLECDYVRVQVLGNFLFEQQKCFYRRFTGIFVTRISVFVTRFCAIIIKQIAKINNTTPPKVIAGPESVKLMRTLFFCSRKLNVSNRIRSVEYFCKALLLVITILASNVYTFHTFMFVPRQCMFE